MRNKRDSMNMGSLRFILPMFAAVLLGGLAGAGAMMLYAPRSGKETRKQIKDTTRRLSTRTVGNVKGAVKKAASRTRRMSKDVLGKADGLQEQGREAIADRLGKVESGVKAARKAIHP